MLVKICGVSTPAALDAAVAGGASHVGLVFFAPSPRNLDTDRAAALAERLPAAVRAVGVFVNPDDELVARAVREARLGAIQLHDTDPGRVAALRRSTGVETWAAIGVRTRADLDRARLFREAADRMVYDAKTPAGSALPGGMGLRFDWALLDGFAHPLPWVLSGGLDSDNVAEAIRRTGARAVDVSSGVESAPGVKDVDKIAAFLHAAAA